MPKKKLADRMAECLANCPNGIADDIALVWNLYPQWKQGDPANGARMSNIRRIAHRDSRFVICGSGARSVALIG